MYAPWNGFTDGIHKVRDKGARAKRGRRDFSIRLLPIQNIVCCVLRLSGGMHNQFAVVVQLLEPASDVRGLIVDDRG